MTLVLTSRHFSCIQLSAPSFTDKRPLSRWLAAERQLRELARLNHVREHGGKALRVVDLELHVVVALEYREVSLGPSLHNGSSIFEMVLHRSEFPKRAIRAS